MHLITSFANVAQKSLRNLFSYTLSINTSLLIEKLLIHERTVQPETNHCHISKIFEGKNILERRKIDIPFWRKRSLPFKVRAYFFICKGEYSHKLSPIP